MKNTRAFFLLVAATVAPLMISPVVWAASPRKAAKPRLNAGFLVYIGTYTAQKSKGIYAYRFVPATGELTSLGLVAETKNPAFLAFDPARKFLYAVNETGDYEGKKSGGVTAFAIDYETGKLALLNQVASRGSGPCHIAVDKTGKYILVANYSAGNVAVFSKLEDGRLGDAMAFVQHRGSSVDHKRQEGPHAHSIGTSPDNRYVLTADLGLDRLLVYRFDAAHGTLAPNDPPFATLKPGSGPRHFAIHPNGKFVYVISEMGSTVTAFSYAAAYGALHELQTISTLPQNFKGQSDCAEIAVHPSGKFLYGSNRGHDSIAVYAIDPRQGTLAPVEHVSTQGKTPRNFAIDPTGAYLFAANQDSNNIVVFHVDSHTGRLTPTGQVLEVPAPVCVTFVAK